MKPSIAVWARALAVKVFACKVQGERPADNAQFNDVVFPWLAIWNVNSVEIAVEEALISRPVH